MQTFRFSLREQSESPDGGEDEVLYRLGTVGAPDQQAAVTLIQNEFNIDPDDPEGGIYVIVDIQPVPAGLFLLLDGVREDGTLLMELDQETSDA